MLAAHNGFTLKASNRKSSEKYTNVWKQERFPNSHWVIERDKRETRKYYKINKK